MKKRIWALLVTIAMVLCLSACMKEEKGIEITPTGSVKLLSKVSMNEQVITSTYGSVDAFYEASTQDMEKEGYTVEKFSETDESGATWYGYSATSKAVPKANAQEALQALMGEEYTVTLNQSGFFVKSVTVHLDKAGDGQGGYESYGMEGYESYFSIRVPSAISETDGAIEPDDNKIAKWDLSPMEFGGTGSLDMTVTYFNLTALLIIIGAIIVIAAAIVTVLVILNTKKKKADETLYGGFGEATQGFSNFEEGVESEAGAEAAAEEVQADVEETAGDGNE